jgi:hypothetical protein
MGLRKVGSAMRAEARAILATQGRERYSEQNALSDHGQKIDLVVLNFVCVGVVGPLLIHLIKVDAHALNKWRQAPPTHTGPRCASGAGNMNTSGERFKMDRDINGRVNYSGVVKFEIKNCDSNLDVFSSSRAAQQFNCINDKWLSQSGPA